MKNGNISIDTAIVAAQKGKERDYWLKQFPGVPEKVSFPHDTPGGVSTGFRADKLEFSWQENLFKKLLTVMKGSEYKLYMILVAGLVLLLKKYTGKNDITVGTPVLKQGIDVKFINTVLALRNHIDADMTFKDFLLQVRQTIIEGTGHQNYPIKSLLKVLNITDADREEDFPLFDTVILLTNIHDKNYLGDIQVNTVFSFSRADDHVKAELEYNSLRYEPTTLENLMAHLAFLLSDALDNPGKKLGAIEIIGEVEKKRLLLEFNDTGAEFPAGRTIGEFFTGQVEKGPDHLAALYEENQITYGELQKKAKQLAEHLKKKGVRSNDIVGLMVDRSLEMIIGILGIINAGSAYLPLDSEYPGERNLFLLKDSGSRILLCQKRSTENHHDILDYLSREHVIFLEEPALYTGKEIHLEISNYPQDPVYVIYTSGTSGTPKGVIVEHRNVLNLVFGLEKRIYYRYSKPLHVCMVSPYVFDASVKQVFAVLLLGHSLYVVSQQTRADARALIEYYWKYQVEVSDGTPAHISLLWGNLQGSSFVGENTRMFPVKCFIIGGEALSIQVVERFLALFGTNPPAIINVYGPTECCVDAASFEVLPQSLHLYRSIPIGKPMPNFRIFILDREGFLQPVGISGELCIAGSGVSRGYLNRPGLTAEKFCLRRPGGSFRENRPLDPRKSFLLDHSPLYQTGDLARWLPGGNIEYHGRIDQQVKIRGFRVELGEIENTLLAHDDIDAAVVIAQETGEGDRYLCGYFQSNKTLDSLELKKYLARTLPGYLIPLYLMQIREIPITTRGKVDRQALPSPGISTGADYIAPRDEIEKKLAEIWTRILDRESPGIDDNFFEIGGHSLKAAVLIANIHKTFNVRLSLGQVFNCPTIREMGQIIGKSNPWKERSVQLKPVEKKEYYPLSLPQERMYRAQQINMESKEYNVPFIVVKLEGGLDRENLEKAFKKLGARHESFRTSFGIVNERHIQKIGDEREMEFKIDYYEAAEEEAQTIVNRYIRPFDLSRAPLVRVGLIKTGKQNHILMVDMHHIITDATSNQVFTRELAALYRGETLPKNPITYKDFSEWQNRRLSSREVKKQQEYWLKEFETPVPVLTIPYDYTRPEFKSYEGYMIAFEMEEGILEKLQAIAIDEGATLYMVFLTLFMVLLYKLGGQEDIIVGTEHAGRQHAGLEYVIGIFVNAFAIRGYPGEEKTFAEFLEEIKKKTIEAFDNQDIQFENLEDKVLVNRDPSRNPFYDVMFSYHNLKKVEAGDLQKKISQENKSPLTFTKYSFDYKVSLFDLMLHGEERNNKVDFFFEYCNKLFKKETIQRYIGYFKVIAAEVAGSPGKRLKDIEISRGLLTAGPQTKTIDPAF